MAAAGSLLGRPKARLFSGSLEPSELGVVAAGLRCDDDAAIRRGLERRDDPSRM